MEFPVGSNSSASDPDRQRFQSRRQARLLDSDPRGHHFKGLSIFSTTHREPPALLNTSSSAVTVCEPQDVTYANSPVKWIADSRDVSHAVTAMQIYVDHKLVVNSPSSSINENLRLPNGTHVVITKARDSSGSELPIGPNHIDLQRHTGRDLSTSDNSLNVCSLPKTR